MTTSTKRKKNGIALLFPIALLVAVFFMACQTDETGAKQETFALAEDAVVAMVEALEANNEDKLAAIFGPETRDVMFSGDVVADQRGRDLFIAAYYERCVLVDEEKKKVLHVGSEDWPFPVPLVKEAAGWRFDTAIGVDELRYRRIGRNELATIRTCKAYVAAQEEYGQVSRDGRPAGAYAQKFVSDPDKQNGLYWKSKPDEDTSPLGELAAEAAAEGYKNKSSPEKPIPFRGYYFRILTAHSISSKEGIVVSYMVDGEMRNGFALVAFPAEYDKSGVMTFIVDQSGTVYEKDLGEETEKLVKDMKSYNPDNTWNPVDVQDL